MSLMINSMEFERLKVQKALPRDSFIKELPFFNFTSLSKESQIKELFQDASDPNLYKTLIKNIISLPEEKNSELLTKRLSAMQVMGFAQIILYKILPCCEENCQNAPREVAPRNQYKDYEYSCPFYHHDKDRRRMVVTPKIEEEFNYKANYLVDGKNSAEKEKHSLNYFESMFHPLYYKMFKCKRESCNFSQFCPFFHSEEEKKTWDNMFSNFIRKDRVSYVKDKQKYYESSSNNQQQQQQSPTSPKSANPYYRNQNNRSNNKQRAGKNQQTGSPLYGKSQNMEWKADKRVEPHSATKWENNKQRSFKNFRKDSGESFDGHFSPVSFGTFYDSREMINNRMC